MIIPELTLILKQSIMITGFVYVMMLIIEYINVQTHGIWQEKLSANQWRQYLFAALLGIIPGCLGAFTIVTMYSHRLISFGAIVTAMIATSGDEAFLMLATIPKTAALITVILFGIGIVAGFIVDKFVKSNKIMDKLSGNELPLHTEDNCKCFDIKNIFLQLRNPSIYRIILITIVSILFIGVLSGLLAGDEEQWIRISLILVIGISLFIVLTVPDHFLIDHLWGHVTKVHTPKIFMWIFGTLLVLNILLKYINIETYISENIIFILIIAVLIGIIPESGPHFIFITLFAQGAIPFSVLLASSISQDGHGMLPLLAESRKSFFTVKLVNVTVALVVGLIGLLFETYLLM
jgi:hypothetical protein